MKKEYIILAAIIIALSLYLAFHKSGTTHYKLPEIAGLSSTDITRLEIQKSGSTILLNRTDKKWHIGSRDYLADTAKIDKILEAISGLQLTDLISETKSYIRYDLGDDKRITVKAWQDDILKREFDIGKTGPSHQHTFIRLAGDDNVYQAAENFRRSFELSEEDLRDKTVMFFETIEIQGVKITKKDKSLSLAMKFPEIMVSTDQEKPDESKPPEEPEWLTPDGKKGDRQALDRLVSTLSSLKCEKYIEDTKKEDMKNPDCTIELIGAKTYTLSLFKKMEGDEPTYHAISSENTYPFVLPKWRAEDFMKDPGELLMEADK